MKSLFLIAAIAVAMSSCSVIKTGTSKRMDIIGAGVIHLPVVAELDVQQKKQSLRKTYKGIKNIEEVKNDAVSELLKLHSADVLIEPTFQTETRGNETELTVNGWPATYKNFRTMEEQDIRLIETIPGVIQKAEAYDAPSVEKKRRK